MGVIIGGEDRVKRLITANKSNHILYNYNTNILYCTVLLTPPCVCYVMFRYLCASRVRLKAV